jgi:hypothetical protein
VQAAARNAGLPFLQVPTVSAVRVMEALGPLLGLEVPEHLRAASQGPPLPAVTIRADGGDNWELLAQVGGGGAARQAGSWPATRVCAYVCGEAGERSRGAPVRRAPLQGGAWPLQVLRPGVDELEFRSALLPDPDLGGVDVGEPREVAVRKVGGAGLRAGRRCCCCCQAAAAAGPPLDCCARPAGAGALLHAAPLGMRRSTWRASSTS